MQSVLQSKKMVAFIVGVSAVSGLALAGVDLEVIKWVGGFISTMVGSFCFGQGFADGFSGGQTSALQ